MRLALFAATLLCLYSSPAKAQDEEALANYLKTTGLTSQECLERAPGKLMGWIVERQKLRYGGTTGDDQDDINQFYNSYRAVLQPIVDARYPKAKALRVPLQQSLCLVYDFIHSVRGNRSYVTHERIAGATEHLLAELYAASGPMLQAADGHPTRADLVVFGRLKAVLSTDYGTAGFDTDYNWYSAKLLALVKTAEAADPTIPAIQIRFSIIEFIDRFPEQLLESGLQ